MPNLDAMLAQLRATGATVTDEPQDMEGVGRFGWVEDPETEPIHRVAVADYPSTHHL